MGLFAVAVSPDILIGPRLKVERANSHIDEIVACTAPLSREWHTIQIEPDTKPPYAQPTTLTLRYRPTKPIAELIALIIGDAAHNLRGALDLLATGIRQSSAPASRGYFPMRERREDLITSAGEPIPDLASIEAALPGSADLLLNKIRPADGPNEHFWSFYHLNNDDKHNLILPTIVFARIQGINARWGLRNTMRDCTVGGDATKPMDLISSDGHFTVEDNFNTIVEVKFGEGTAFENDPVVPTLTQISGVVTSTLDQFEALIRNCA